MQNNYCFGRWMIYFYGIGSSEIAALMAQDLFLHVGKACKAVNDPHLQKVQSAILGDKRYYSDDFFKWEQQ